LPPSGRIDVFSEKLAINHHPMTGEWFEGTGKHEPICDLLSRPVAERDSGFPLALIS
jgi:hypothetical protein